MQSATASIQAFTRPFAPFHDVYQAYYHESLRRHCRTIGVDFRVVSLSRFPRFLRTLRQVRDIGERRRVASTWVTPRIDRLGRRLEGPVDPPSTFFHDITGQYLAMTHRGSKYHLCIDSSDYPEPGSENLVRWSDIYFKTNLWSSRPYPANVVPLANCDPTILTDISRFRALRRTDKEFDLCFIVRVWGGRDGIEGIEHNLRLLEAVNRVKCNKFVLAVLVIGDRDRDSRFLRSLSVPYTTKNIKARDLWQVTAKSRLNILRLGVHHCVPWRMTGALAIGSCVVLDRTPLSTWQEPLRNEVNYLSLGVNIDPETPAADRPQYTEIPDKIESWLASEDRLARIRKNNGEYFDRFMEPDRIGSYIVSEIERLEQAQAAAQN